eukprot:CAMPEP_0115360020 /NCGR_PEP_ID=MMETSP0270-20121206/101473_1 /TAXON_ID=71861 /ORGANISM="Scrippsiella trochoidea, Strain CCMP3099" /LENGTH=82 /DNA_ID=CAMNT_0002782545 /DNA_START=304 /DNA_END=550 /DNA_ORIENTATION=-
MEAMMLELVWHGGPAGVHPSIERTILHALADRVLPISKLLKSVREFVVELEDRRVSVDLGSSLAHRPGPAVGEHSAPREGGR